MTWSGHCMTRPVYWDVRKLILRLTLAPVKFAFWAGPFGPFCWGSPECVLTGFVKHRDCLSAAQCRGSAK